MLAAKHCSMLFSTTLQEVVHFFLCTAKNAQPSCSGLMKTGLNNVVLPTLFNVVNNIIQHC